MKKILLLILISIFSLSSIFAASNEVNIFGEIELDPFSYILKYYDNTVISDSISISSGDLSINKTFQSHIFSLFVSGNNNVEENLMLSINSSNFIRNIDENYFDSNILVKSFYLDESDNYFEFVNHTLLVPAGLHKDLLIFRFVLRWTGKSNLPAGSYQANVQVSLSSI